MIVTCLNCSKEFEKSLRHIEKSPNHFCSRSCSATTHNKTQPKHPPKQRICTLCDVVYTQINGHVSKKYCQDCSNEFSKRTERLKVSTLGELRARPSLQGKHPIWFHNYLRGFSRSWNQDIAKLPCQVCGYDKHTELCHIKPIADWEDTALLGEVNSPDNLYVLCPNHHWELDHTKDLIVPHRGNAPRSLV